MKPIICYENIVQLADCTVTASSQDAGYEAINATTWLPYEWWSPSITGTHTIDFEFTSSQRADYFGVFSHNLGEENSTIALSYWNGSSYVQVVTPTQKENSEVILRTFTSATSTKWRVTVVAGSADVMVGVIAIGEYMQMPLQFESGFSLPHLEYDDRYVNNTSDTGLLLGRSVLSKSLKATFPFRLIQQSWIRANWIPFLHHANNDPFFVSWDAANYPDDAVFCITDGQPKAPRFGEAELMDVTLKCQAWHQLRV